SSFYSIGYFLSRISKTMEMDKPKTKTANRVYKIKSAILPTLRQAASSIPISALITPSFLYTAKITNTTACQKNKK
ncbi:MAG TPA: hypothetical protein PKN81_12045, partial [Anaerolineales bacterium]|nr:hypothetical protein [Anaerolineales bacterium]